MWRDVFPPKTPVTRPAAAAPVAYVNGQRTALAQYLTEFGVEGLVGEMAVKPAVVEAMGREGGANAFGPFEVKGFHHRQHQGFVRQILGCLSNHPPPSRNVVGIIVKNVRDDGLAYHRSRKCFGRSDAVGNKDPDPERDVGPKYGELQKLPGVGRDFFYLYPAFPRQRFAKNRPKVIVDFGCGNNSEHRSGCLENSRTMAHCPGNLPVV